MNKCIFLLVMIILNTTIKAQIQRPRLPKTNVVTKQPVTTPATPEYVLSSIKLHIQTGNDNKEIKSIFTLSVKENNTAWGPGRDLLTLQNQYPEYELKINSTSEIALQRYPQTAADAFTLTNLQTKGLNFTIRYYPAFIYDAWKIDAVIFTIEIKDQFGRLHPTMPYQTIRFNNTAGVLGLGGKGTIMRGATTTDGFYTPQTVTISDK